VTAAHAESQVKPCVTDFQTIFTSIGAWGDVFDLVQMSTFVRHNTEKCKPS